MYKIKIGLLLLVGFISHVLQAESKEPDLLDIFQNQEELIKEGQKQFLELLKFNAENERRGCPEDNIYVFSLVNSDDWSKYVKVPNTPAEEYLGETKDKLNNRLKAFNTNPEFSDFGMYLCLVTELSAKVAYNFPAASLASIKAMYERNEKEVPGFSSAESAANIEKLEEQWDNIIKQVFDGTEQQLLGDPNFASFQPKPNRMYVTQTLVKAQIQDPEQEIREVKKVINSARIRGYFKQHWDEIYKYEKRMLKTRSGEHYKLENRVLSAIEYVEGGMDSNPAPSMNFKLEEQTKIKNAANQATNNTYTSTDLANQNLFLFDFTGIYGTNSQVAVDAINTVLSGQLAKSSTKLKVFITDPAVSQTTIDMIKNINILDPAYENSLILWLNIDNDAVIETSIRVSPDLQNEINAHLDWERFNQLLQDGSYVDMALFTAKQILDIKIKVIYGISEFVRTVLQAGIIPPKYYDMTDMNQYNPILKDIMTYVNPAMAFSAVVMQPLLDEFGGMYPVLLGANITDIQFALFCGFWNGILLELDGIFEVISMVGYFVDERKKAEVDQVIDVFQKTDFLDLVEKMLNGAITAHTGHPTFVAHQIGKDIIMILTIAIPVSKVGTVGKLAKVTKVINAVDKLNPLTHVFDAAGFILKKGTGKVVKIMKGGINGTKLAELTKGRLRVFQQHLYTGAQNLIQLTEPISVPQVVLDAGNGILEAASIVLVKADGPGGPSYYFRKLADDASLAAIKNFIKGNFDFAKLFKNAEEAELIAGKIASLPSASKLYDVTNFPGLKAAIDALPDDLKRTFFKDLADIGESAGNSAGSIWLGKHLDDFASKPTFVQAWELLHKNPLIRINHDYLEKLVKILDDSPKMIAAGFDQSFFKKLFDKMNDNPSLFSLLADPGKSNGLEKLIEGIEPLELLDASANLGRFRSGLAVGNIGKLKGELFRLRRLIDRGFSHIKSVEQYIPAAPNSGYTGGRYMDYSLTTIPPRYVEVKYYATLLNGDNVAAFAKQLHKDIHDIFKRISIDNMDVNQAFKTYIYEFRKSSKITSHAKLLEQVEDMFTKAPWNATIINGKTIGDIKTELDQLFSNLANSPYDDLLEFIQNPDAFKFIE